MKQQQQKTSIFPLNSNTNTSISNNTNNQVNIICKIHGIFEQCPSDHLSSKGCSKCTIVNNSNEPKAPFYLF